MVESERDAATGQARFVLSANSSMTQRQMTGFLLAAGVGMAGIGIGFSLLGLWLVWPFSGAEWLLLAYACKASLERSRMREVLTIDEATVRLETGRDKPNAEYCFQRAWLSVVWNPAEFRGHPGRLAIRSHGKQVEIGSFLAEPERERLARELRRFLR